MTDSIGQLETGSASARETDATPSASAAEPQRIDLRDYAVLDRAGWFHVGFASCLTALSIWLSLQSTWLWLTGQGMLALVMIQWFAILHEAGHKTLFRTRLLNRWAAHLAGFWALIPGDCWRIVHAKHHYWTGWQDKDMTTQSLVPRRLSAAERLVINAAWRLWIPLFATLYRVNNYWNLLRLRQLFTKPADRRLLTANVLVYLAVYLLIVWILGWPLVLRCLGLALFVSFALQDLIILSQHTHIPMTLAGDDQVTPYSPREQNHFTRSLIFPRWFARLFLLNMDAHALHHMHPSIPGYQLHRLNNDDTANATPWWMWVLRAKSVRGDVLLFQNRDQTGFYF